MQIVYADVQSLRELDVNIERPDSTAADLPAALGASDGLRVTLTGCDTSRPTLAGSPHADPGAAPARA
jgi:hypothetical protein